MNVVYCEKRQGFFILKLEYTLQNQYKNTLVIYLVPFRSSDIAAKPKFSLPLLCIFNRFCIMMSNLRHTMVDGPKFWISHQRSTFLSIFSCWQLIQNLALYTTSWCPCDIQISLASFAIQCVISSQTTKLSL